MFTKSGFGFLRSIMWPIHRHEWRTILPMVLLIFLISLNYTLLRNMKDALLVTENASAESIPFIHVWAMLPASILLTLVFAKLSRHYSRERVFSIMTSGFLGFYLFFLFVLYPYRDLLHPDELAAHLTMALPEGCKGLISMIHTWTFTLFYVSCELWSVMILSLLFWGFANESTRLADSKRFYAVWNISANVAAVLAGQIPSFFSQFTQEESLSFLLLIVVTAGCVSIVLFKKIDRDSACLRSVVTKPLSGWQCVSSIFGSKSLLCIAMMVIGYNLVIQMVEVVWKNELLRRHTDFSGYNAYLGDLTTLIGIVSILLASLLPLFLNGLGWTRTALVTPVCMLVTGIVFFSILFWESSLAKDALVWMGTAPLTILLFTGAFQVVSSKAFKYSLFDATKEMVFIPLNDTHRTVGKAAIDGIASRVGKSGGSLLFQGLLLFTGSLRSSAGVIAAVLLLVVMLWILAVRQLGRGFPNVDHSIEANGTSNS